MQTESDLRTRVDILQAAINKEKQVGGVPVERDEIMALLLEWEHMKEGEASFRKQCKEKAENMETAITQFQVMRDERQSLINACRSRRDTALELQSRIESLDAEIRETQVAVEAIPTLDVFRDYQRLFFDLYARISEDLVQLKSVYSYSNMLDMQQGQQLKELNYLQSVRDQFHVAQTSRYNQDTYLNSLYDYLCSLQEILKRTQKALEEELARRTLFQAEADQLKHLQQETKNLLDIVHSKLMEGK